MKYLLVALLGVFLSNGLYAQFELKGKLTDSTTSEPLAYSTLGILNQLELANADGSFRFANLPEGKHVLNIEFLGQRYVRLLELHSDTFIPISLNVPGQLLHQLVVHAHEHDEDDLASFKAVINASELERKAAMSISEALRDVNGVGALRTGFGIAKPVISGMHSNRISMLQNGSLLENQQWGREHSPSLDPLNGNSLELIRGAGTLLYSNNAFGGVIRLIPSDFGNKDMRRIKLFSSIGSNPVGAHLGLQLGSFNAQKKWGHRFSVNARKAGDTYSPTYVLSNTGTELFSTNYYTHLHLGPHQWSLNVSSYNQKVGILKSSHIGNLTDLERALVSDSPLIINPYAFAIGNPFQQVGHHSAQLVYERLHLMMGDLKISLSHQLNNRSEFDNHGVLDNAALKLSLNTTQLRLYADKHWSNLRLEYGGTFEYQQNVYQGRYFIPNYRRNKYGAFALLTYQLNKLLLEAGGRWDDQALSTFRYVDDSLNNDNLSFGGLSWSLGGRYAFNDKWNLRLSLGRRFRAPEINELYSNGLHHGSASLEFGSLDLNKEVAYSLSGALKYEDQNTRFVLEPYVHRFVGFINLEPTGQPQLSIRGAFPVFRYIQSNAVYKGVDLQINRTLSSKWSTQFQGSLVHAMNLDSNQFLYGIPAPRLGLGFRRIFNPDEGLGNTYVQLKANYSFRHAWAELEQDFTAPPAAYLLLDLELGKAVQALRGFLTLRLSNALNQNYRDYMNRYRYFADEQGLQLLITYKYTIQHHEK